MKLYLFENKPLDHSLCDSSSLCDKTIMNSDDYVLRVYEPFDRDMKPIINIFLVKAKEQFKLLMPNAYKLFIQSTLLNPNKSSNYFLKTNPFYQHKTIVLSSQSVYKCFGDSIFKDLNLLLIVNFLIECPVHTLIYLKNVSSFDIYSDQTDPGVLINHLNSLWGQKYFSLKRIITIRDYLLSKVHIWILRYFTFTFFIYVLFVFKI